MESRMPAMPNEQEAFVAQLAFEENRSLKNELRERLVEAGIVPASQLAELAVGIDEGAIEKSPSGVQRSPEQAKALRIDLDRYKQAHSVEAQLEIKKAELLVPMRNQQQKGRAVARRILDELATAYSEK